MQSGILWGQVGHVIVATSGSNTGARGRVRRISSDAQTVRALWYTPKPNPDRVPLIIWGPQVVVFCYLPKAGLHGFS